MSEKQKQYDEEHEHKRVKELVDHYVSKWEDNGLPKDWKDMRDFAEYIVSTMLLTIKHSF